MADSSSRLENLQGGELVSPAADDILYIVDVSVPPGILASKYVKFSTLVNAVAFASLDDGPGSFTGNANKGVVVNSGETGLEYAELLLQEDFDDHLADVANPHAVTKTQVGLSSVSNDAQLKIASNLSDVANAGTARTNLGAAAATDLATHIADVANPHVVTKTQVGLANVVNGLQLQAANNLSDLANAGTARTNLGLGTMAVATAANYALVTALADEVAAREAHEADFDNPHQVTYAQVGAAGLHLFIVNVTDDHILELDDDGKMVRLDKVTAVELEVPPNSDEAFVVGTTVGLRQAGVGQVTIVAGAGVTINTPATLKLRTQHSSASLVKVATNEWDLLGDLEELP